MHSMHLTSSRVMRTCAFAAAIGIPCGFVAAFGFKPPPGNTHHWTGNTSDSWHVSSNWTTGVVPADEDAAIILDGPFNNIFLDDDTANLASLYIGSHKTVANQGHLIRVLTGQAETTITGADSSIFLTVMNGGVPGFRTDILSVENEGRVTMAGGRLLVNEQMTLISDGRVNGHGLIEVNSSNAAAFNGLNGSVISVSGGDLRIDVNNGGSLVLPPDVLLWQDGRTLELDGPFFLPAQNVQLSSDCTIDVQSDWSLTGLLEAEPDADTTSTVMGDGMFTVDGDVSVTGGGRLLFDTMVEFEGGSSMAIGNGSTVELGDTHDAQPGQSTTIAQNGRLHITGPQLIGVWSGDINSSAGTIDVSNDAGFWSFDGTLTLGSFFGLRTHIAGTSSLQAHAEVIAPGLGGIVDGELELMPTASFDLTNTVSRLYVNGRMQIHGGADVTGLGWMEVNDEGTMLVGEPANIEVDVYNSGEFAVGTVDDQIGYAYLDRSFVQFDSGSYVVQMVGAAPTMRDVLETAEGVELAGELVIQLTDGFEPSVGDSFEIIYANGGVTGTFDSISGDPGFTVQYTDMIVSVTYEGETPCPADISGDGMVDVDDLLELLSAWGPCDECAADLDGSGAVDVTDLLELLAAWGNCTV